MKTIQIRLEYVPCSVEYACSHCEMCTPWSIEYTETNALPNAAHHEPIYIMMHGYIIALNLDVNSSLFRLRSITTISITLLYTIRQYEYSSRQARAFSVCIPCSTYTTAL